MLVCITEKGIELSRVKMIEAKRKNHSLGVCVMYVLFKNSSKSIRHAFIVLLRHMHKKNWISMAYASCTKYRYTDKHVCTDKPS